MTSPQKSQSIESCYALPRCNSLEHKFKSYPINNKLSLYKDLLYIAIDERFDLAPLQIKHAAALAKIGNNENVQREDFNFQLPFQEKDAEHMIQQYAKNWNKKLSFNFGIFNKEAQLMGCICFRLYPDHRFAEIGYWLGEDYWGQGYATEVLKATVPFCFATFDIDKISANYLETNPQSGHVLKKAGFELEGTLRKHWMKNGVRKDVNFVGIFHPEYIPE